MKASDVHPVVDTHAHVWNLGSGPPFSPTVPHALIPRETAPLEALIRDMNRAGVDRAVLVQASAYGWDNRHLADLVAEHPERLHGVILVDPFDPAGPDTLSLWIEDYGLQGLRINAVHYPADELLPACRPLCARAAELDVPVCFQLRPDQMRLLANLTGELPGLTVVVDHLAFPDPDDPASLEPLLALSDEPRVYVKVSGFHAFSREPYPHRDCSGFVERTYRAFGAGRLMWASNHPLVLETASYEETLGIVDRWDFLRSQDRPLLLGAVADGLWPTKTISEKTIREEQQL